LRFCISKIQNPNWRRIALSTFSSHFVISSELVLVMGWASILWSLISLPIAKTSQELSEALGFSGLARYTTLRYDIYVYLYDKYI